MVTWLLSNSRTTIHGPISTVTAQLGMPTILLTLAMRTIGLAYIEPWVQDAAVGTLLRTESQWSGTQVLAAGTEVSPAV